MEKIYDLLTDRFSNESVEVKVVKYNDENWVTLHEITANGYADSPVALVYDDNYEMKVKWFRLANLSDYQRNRFEFQLHHLVKDYEMRAKRFKRIHGGDE